MVAAPETREPHARGTGDSMAEIDDIYSTRLFELASDIPRSARLPAPDATATAHSKLCGSTITVDLKVDGDRVSDFGQTVKACLLGQASAAVLGREIVGSSAGELRQIAAEMRRMLKESGTPPTGRWADLAMLQPVKDYKARHTSTLLVFEAVERALAEIETKTVGGGRERYARETQSLTATDETEGERHAYYSRSDASAGANLHNLPYALQPGVRGPYQARAHAATRSRRDPVST